MVEFSFRRNSGCPEFDEMYARWVCDLRDAVAQWNAGSATVGTLDVIFGQDRGYPQGWNNVDVLLEMGRQSLIPARLSPLPIVSTEDYERISEVVQDSPYADADFSQGPLKVRAIRLLEIRGATEISIEGPYCAGRYDVAADEIGCVVECGNTRIEKLLTVALSGHWRDFILVPRIGDDAIVFDLGHRRLERIAGASRKSGSPSRCALALLNERRLTNETIERCIRRINAPIYAAIDRLGALDASHRE